MRTIPLFKVFMSSTAGDSALKTLYSGFIGQGEKVRIFEEKLIERIGNHNLITLNSGTSAIHLALHILRTPYLEHVEGGATIKWRGLEYGAEILTTPLTCLATNMPILANNCSIKWVDVDKKTMNMDLEDLMDKISEKTRAIIVVHWGGYPVDLDTLKAIQKYAENKYGYKPAIIEDCAHAFWSKFNGKPIGSHGNICAFSFQAIKHLTTIDGGMLTLPHKEMCERAKLLRWYGIDRQTPKVAMRCEDDVKEWGYKFHMNDVCASIGIENLMFVDEIIKCHIDNSEYYDHKLAGIDGVKLLQRDERMQSSSWIYSMLVENKSKFIAHMEAHGIAASQVHERNDKHSCFDKFKSELPNLDEVIPKLVSIPVGWWVTHEDRDFIVKTIRNGW